MPTRGPIPPLKKGNLTKFGYHSQDSEAMRHTSLKKAAAAYGNGKVRQMLNAVVVLNKTRNRPAAAIFKQDIAYLQSLT